MDEEVVSCVPSSKGAQRFPRSLYYVAVIVWVLAGSRSRLNDCDLFGFSRLVRSPQLLRTKKALVLNDNGERW